jgi:phosphoglycolate phosphatase-like HAD superfamily hydrolase
MQPKLVLFDVDGTLVDTAGAGRRAMERAFHGVFGVDGFERAARVAFAGRTDPVILESTAEAIGIEPHEFRRRRVELEACFVREIEAEMRRPDDRRRVLPGVPGLLEALEAMDGVHLGLVTGNLEPGARAKLEPFRLNRYFPTGGFASDDPDRRKIAEIAGRKLSELAGIAFEAAHVTVVGDTHHDVDCARANGFRAVALDSGWVSRETLERARPDVLLDDLSDRARVLEALFG